MKEKSLLTSKEVSKSLSISLRTLQKLSKEGRIKAIKVGRQWRYNKSDVEGYLNFGTDFSKESVKIPCNFIERRAYPRINSNFKCSYSINLPPFKNINSEGIIKDLSAGGILLINQDNEMDEIKVNDPIDLQFVLISDSDQRIHISTKGKVVWKEQDGVGIKFKNINKETQDRILEYTS